MFVFAASGKDVLWEKEVFVFGGAKKREWDALWAPVLQCFKSFFKVFCL